jgi:ammonium transporter Rh
MPRACAPALPRARARLAAAGIFGLHARMCAPRLAPSPLPTSPLRSYSWSAVGYNYLIASVGVQWAVLTVGFFAMAYGKSPWALIPVNLPMLIEADFGAASLLIAFGAVLGKTSATQLLVMAAVHIAVYAMCLGAVTLKLFVFDIGGAITIHTFGAFFGLAASRALGAPRAGAPAAGMTKWSSTVAIAGTVFLFIYWPSFNAALAPFAYPTDAGMPVRCVVNTLLSITSSVVAAFCVSRVLRPARQFDYEDLQNATLAGGVAMGAAAGLVIYPWGAMLTGNVAGALSAASFALLTPAAAAAGLHDTCGVLSLHGLPGILGGLASAVSAAANANAATYGDTLDAIFPQVAAGAWTPVVQGGYQVAGTLVAVAFGVGGGTLAGWLMALPAFAPPPPKDFFQDAAEWHVATTDLAPG